MQQLQLNDLFPKYPSVDISTQLAHQYEFASIKSPANEAVPEPGGVFNYQEQMWRYLRVYPGSLAFDDAGTGKSRLALYTAEQLLYDPSSGITKVVVLTKNHTLIDEMITELIKFDNGRRYLTQKAQQAKNERSRRHFIETAIKRAGYQFWTFISFANYTKNLGDQDITNQFSQTFFIVDEIHYLRSEQLTASENQKTSKHGKPIGTGLGDVYFQMIEVFQRMQWSKFIGLSATPMINDVNEIGPIYNLILYALKREPFPLDTNFSEVTLQQLYDKMKGLISVVKSTANDSVLMLMGETVELEKDNVEYFMTLQLSPMIDQQLETYQNMPRSRLYTQERQVANIVYPDGTYGKPGYRHFVSVNKQGIPQPQGQLIDIMHDRDLALQYCAKIVTIGDIELERSTQPRPGKSWIISEYVENGIHAVVMYLLANGFEIYTGETPAVNQYGYIELPMAQRVAFITGKTTAARNRRIRELYNADIDGQYLQVLAGSEIAQTGINLYDTLRIHSLEPYWNKATQYQSQGRALRAVSHQRLKERAIREGSSDRIAIEIYDHCVTLGPDLGSVDPSKNDFNIDLYIYYTAESKEIEVAEMIQKYSQIAWDCPLNHQRNQAAQGVRAVQYRCYPPIRTGPMDYSNFLAWYASPEIRQIIEYLREQIFRSNFSFDVSQLYEAVPANQAIAEILINMSLRQIYVDRVPMVDRFGYRSLVQQIGDLVFIQRGVQEDVQVGSSYYSDKIYGRIPRTNYQISQQIDHDKIDTIRHLILEDAPDIVDQIRGLTLEAQADLLQYAMTHPDDPASPFLLDLYVFYIHEFSDPKRIVEQVYQQGLVTQAGRPVNPNNLNRRQKELVDAYQDPGTEPKVLIHTLLLYAANLTQHSLLDQILEPKYKAGGTAKIRIYQDSQWHDSNQIELAVYQKLIADQMAQRLSRFNDMQVYGIVGEHIPVEDHFWIVDRASQRMITTDKRYRPTGLSCKTVGLKRLLGLLNYLEVGIPAGQTGAKIPLEEKLDFLIQQGYLLDQPYDLDDPEVEDLIMRYHYWSSIGIDHICRVVLNAMIAADLIFYI